MGYIRRYQRDRPTLLHICQLWHFRLLRASPLRWAAIGVSIAFAFYFYGQTAMVDNEAVDQELYRVAHTMWHVMIALGQCFVSMAETARGSDTTVGRRRGGEWQDPRGSVAGRAGAGEASTGIRASRRGGGNGGGDNDLGGLADMSVAEMRRLIDGDARLRAVSKAIGGPRGRSGLDMRRDIEEAVVAVG